MRSSFFGLNIASQGLFTAQTALNITNHNISNIETPGYSRQYAQIKATRPLPDGKRGMIGTGAEVIGIYQHRSTYIDNKYWSMSKDLGQYTIKNEMLTQIELLFNEPSDTGYNTYMADLFAKLQGLSTNPSEDAYRANFIDSAVTFADYFTNLGERLDSYQRDANFGIKASVTEINNIAEQIGALNVQIGNIELNGVVANDLRDERALLLDQLSQIINIDAKEFIDINGKRSFTVSINGQHLIDGNSVNYLEVVARTNLNNPEDTLDLYDVQWESGKRLYLNNANTSGRLKGYLDIRDGNNGENFKGTIDSVSGSTPPTLAVSGVSRSDIPSSGELVIGLNTIKYTGFTYDDATNTVTFTLDGTVPASATPGNQVRIGEAVDYKGIPYYKQQLNLFVRTMAMKFNEIHESGNGGMGKPMFTFDGYNPGDLDLSAKSTYNQITVNNFRFSEEIYRDNSLLYTSETSGVGEGANDLLLKLADLKQDQNMFERGKPDSFMQALISEIGIDGKQAESLKKGQENLTRLIENQRKAISSVDINEETADLIRFQQAYNLSAKMIAVMDEIYEVTINQLKR